MPSLALVSTYRVPSGVTVTRGSDRPSDSLSDVVLKLRRLGGWYSVISLHGGGSPEAMKREIWRNYPVMDRVALVERLLDRDVLDRGQRVSKQPGRCCATGCEVPEVPAAAE